MPIYDRLDSEFTPPFDEDALLYMSSTLPGMSITDADRSWRTSPSCVRSGAPDMTIDVTVVRLREILTTHKDLARKPAEMETKYDARFKVVFDAIRHLLEQNQAGLAGAASASCLHRETSRRNEHKPPTRVTTGSRHLSQQWL